MKEQIWLTNVKHMRLSTDTSWVFCLPNKEYPLALSNWSWQPYCLHQGNLHDVIIGKASWYRQLQHLYLLISILPYWFLCDFDSKLLWQKNHNPQAWVYMSHYHNVIYFTLRTNIAAKCNAFMEYSKNLLAIWKKTPSMTVKHGKLRS